MDGQTNYSQRNESPNEEVVRIDSVKVGDTLKLNGEPHEITRIKNEGGVVSFAGNPSSGDQAGPGSDGIIPTEREIMMTPEYPVVRIKDSDTDGPIN